MENLELDKLKSKGIELIKMIISQSKKQNPNSFISNQENAKIEIDSFEYYFPKQIRFISSAEQEKSFALSVYGSAILSENKNIPFTDYNMNENSEFNSNKFYFILHIESFYNQDNEYEIDIENIKIIGNYFNDEIKAKNEWNIIQSRIIESKKIVVSNANSELLEKIDAIEVSEDILRSIGENIDDELFLEKVILLQKVAKIEKPKKVVYEYGSVSSITDQPVLMNMCFTIFLTKKQVVGLVNDLSTRYKNIIENIITQNVSNQFRLNNYKVPVVFGNSERGHADSTKFEILLPKLGDWRTGYRDLYTAELVFHEFSHVLDFGRKMTKYGTATFDVHRHDFVDIFDSVLLDYKDWILDKYNPVMLRDVILKLDSWLNDFQLNYISRISSIAKQEKDRKNTILEDEEQIKKELNISENSFPIHIILTDDRTEKTSYLSSSIDSFLMLKNTPDYIKKSLLDLRIKILDFIDGITNEIVLDKKEMEALIRVIDNASIYDYTSSFTISENIRVINILKEFINELTNLSKNKLPKVKTIEKSGSVEEYPDIDKNNLMTTIF